MNRWVFVCVVLAASSVTAAASINPNEALICAPHGYTECTVDGCQRVDPAAINAPTFIKVDVKRKRLEPMQGGAGVVSKLDHVEQIDGKIIVQGVEDGVEDVRDGIGYTIAIVEDTGDMVFSAASEGVSFVAFGACTNL